MTKVIHTPQTHFFNLQRAYLYLLTIYSNLVRNWSNISKSTLKTSIRVPLETVNCHHVHLKSLGNLNVSLAIFIRIISRVLCKTFFHRSPERLCIDSKSARHILGEKKIIGVSCYNNIDLALYAEKNKASYVSFGSLNKTTTKNNIINLDKDIFSEAKKFLNTTTCLIGGININNIHDAMKLNSNLIAISKGLSSYDQIKKISKAYYG